MRIGTLGSARFCLMGKILELGRPEGWMMQEKGGIFIFHQKKKTDKRR